jgi:hypothetical protein
MRLSWNGATPSSHPFYGISPFSGNTHISDVTTTDWWFEHVLFSIIYGMILPID